MELRQKREAELAAFRLAEAKNNESGWERFLKEFPSGQLAVIAEDRLETLKKIAREKENALYAQALKSGTLEDWDKYITTHPEGRFIREATTKRAEAARLLEEERQRKLEIDTYTRARDADSLESWGDYVSKYPAGPHTGEAGARIEQLKWLAFADTALVPAGAFTMGTDSRGDEKPRHRVELDAFRIGRGEVTNAQYTKFLEETKHRAPADPSFAKHYLAGYPDLPVVGVTYEDALMYCKWLGAKIGTTVRLPTEAEWEYSAIGGKDGYRYPWGLEPPKLKSRYNGNDPQGVKTVVRDAFPANGYGLFNLAGNVAEWVSDFYSDEYYKAPARKNPMGPTTGRERVIRGGSWDSDEDSLRCARRDKENPNQPSDKVGFRIVIIPKPYTGIGPR
jgi:formylglycine-generating enzyme required for sulfatase activity